MPDIKLIEVYGEGFRSLEEPFRVEFPSSGSLLVRGLNKDTGDTSAAGKSSFVLALAQLFGGCPFPGTELATWGRDRYDLGALVEVGGVYRRVERSTSGLVITAADDPSNKKTRGRTAEAELNRIFALPEELRAVTTYRGQGVKSTFLKLADTQLKELLTTILKLEPWLREAQAAGEAVRGLRSELETAAARLSAANALADAAQKLLAEAPPAEPDGYDPAHQLQVARECLEVVDKKLEDLRAKETGLRAAAASALDRSLAEISAAYPGVQGWDERPEVLEAGATKERAETELRKFDSAIEAARQKHESRRRILQSRYDSTNPLVRQRPAIEKRILALLNEREVLEAKQCPTCERSWTEQEGVAAAILKVEEQLRDERDRLEAEADLDRRLDDLRAQIESLPQFDARAGERASLAEKVTVATRAFADAIRAAKLEIKEHDEALEAAKSAAKNRVQEKLATALSGIDAARAVVRKEKDHTAAVVRGLETEAAEVVGRAATRREREDAAKRADEQAVARQLEYRDAEVKLNQELDFLALVGREGFLGAYPDDVLAEVAGETNLILSRVANVRHVAFDYVSERETSSGGLQRKIVPVVTMEGAARPFHSGLSGGMQSAVGLAVDLAWRSVIRKRASAYPNWMVLDESFDGLGKKAKETCLEMLSAYGGDSLFLVIDHSSEMQSFFSDVVTVVSENGRSKIVSG